MKVLVINCGSSSLKYQLIDGQTENVLAKGLCERIGIKGGVLTHESQRIDKVKVNVEMANHEVAFALVIEKLLDSKDGVIKSLDEIGAVGHRIVHGGERFAASILLTEEVLKEVESCSSLAPLHNPANLTGIYACMEQMPKVPMVGVFDTAFHQTMPPKAYLYGIPYDYYEKYRIRRYGFHGTSHKYVSNRAAEILNKNSSELKTIVCHLGNGASICAVDGGKSVDTSMGFTPLEGLIMGTRSGSLDPAIIEFIAREENKSVDEIINMLNKESGILGLSNGLSSDFRDMVQASKEGNEQALIALETYAYRVSQYIGSYAIAMGKVDVIAFTAGVGENNIEVRRLICQYLSFFDTTIDLVKNEIRGEELIISTPESKVTVMIVPTNEELAIARDTLEIINGDKP